MRRPLLTLILLTLLVPFGAASAQVTVTGDLARAFEVQAGALVADTLELRNAGASEARVRVYLTDYAFHADGTSAYPEPGSLPRSNAPWLELGAQAVSVPAGGSVTVPYQVRLPAALAPGSYWSVIMVETVAPRSAADGTLSLQTVVRYGVQVITTLDPAAAELTFANPTFRESGGGSVLTLDVLNSGERSLRASHYLDLFDAAGAPMGRVEGDVRRTYPGTSVRQSFALGELAPGAYLAVVIADAGGDDLFGAQYNLTVE